MVQSSIRLFIVGVAAATLGFTSSVRANGPAGGNDVSYRVSNAEVVIVCPLTVGGSFEARTKDLRGDVSVVPNSPSTVEGSLQVNLQSLETGIGLRDRHMLDNYLEVKKGPDYATATLEDIRIEKLDGKTAMKATLVLHGQRKEITGTAELKQQDGRMKVQAEFPVAVSDFQIPKPSYLGVGVKEVVQVKVSLTAVPVAAATTARR
jgi:polyisoprenoid-binding protein YceI